MMYTNINGEVCNINIKDCKGEAMPPIQFRDASTSTPGNIIQAISEETNARGIPANFRENSIKLGGFFGTNYPCVIISHPNPPQSYFDIIIIINQNILTFQFWGYSKANYDSNRKDMYSNKGTLTGMIRGALVKVDELQMQQETVWYSNILDAIKICTY